MKEEAIQTKTGFLARLQEKWALNSIYQVLIVLLVFSLTGSTVVFIRKAFFGWIGFDETTSMWLKTITYIAFVMPAYQILLLAYGALFGQFTFFWNKEKKMLSKIKKLFVRK
ncbi:DUF6787 family protein [Catalinimonas niigatensis]|uniref:DUF6787 family protein n=1 Tax=Catalinimonas niigatensis TaxID=1397264 RepID=UPI0026657414|nr:DUF6787 family protein [Catalinimonas niigatensis]WPP52093.1 DUF6787 family protein [Catalinimonas niigatensis]